MKDLVSFRGFFWRLNFCMVKSLKFHNSSFALRYFLMLMWHTPCFIILKAETHPFQSLERRFFKTGIKEWLVLVTYFWKPSKNGWFWILIVIWSVWIFLGIMVLYFWTGALIFYNCCYETLKIALITVGVLLFKIITQFWLRVNRYSVVILNNMGWLS